MKSLIWVKLMKNLLLLFIVLLALALIRLPLLVDTYAGMLGVGASNSFQLEVFLYLTAVPFLILLIMLRRLCRNVLRNAPFHPSSITALHVISICAFIDFLLYAIGTLTMMQNLLSFILMIAAFMIGLVSLILAQLFQVSREIKQENDLTI